MSHAEISQSFLEVLEQRHSVRSYSPEKLSIPMIERLLHLAVRAPTALHEETWSFAIVQDMELLKHISDLAKPRFYVEAHLAHLTRHSHAVDIFANPEFNIFYNAGTLILICTRTTAGPFASADCWLAAENLMLAAQALGLGSCVIGSALSTLNEPQQKLEIGIPSDVSVVVPIIVGVPAEPGQPTTRKAPHILAWRQEADKGGR
jgi:nitroreductase